MSKDNLEAFETFEFDLPPIRGFPELRWAGKRPFKSTQYFPAQKKEAYGDSTDGWWNRIYWGDNLQVMSHLLREFRGKVNLIYIDPPFDSGASYQKTIKFNGRKETSEYSAFEEKQYGDIWSSDQYLQFLMERLVLCKELLSDHGSIYVHSDHHRSHHIRSIMDEIFGNGGPDGNEAGYRNSISWCYSDAANSKTKWNTKHDTILFYSKSSKWTFNYLTVLREMSESNVKKYKYEDETGRYRIFGKNVAGSPIQWHRDVDPKWEETHPHLTFRHYLKDGSLPLDWLLINPVNQAAHERQGYPTQKPEELIKKLILSTSNVGDIVFDCFMGSGTTQAVAMKNGRRFIGADINLGAIETTIKRLNHDRKSAMDGSIGLFNGESEGMPTKLYTGFEVYNVNNYDLFRNPVEAKELIREAMELQPLPPSSAFDGQRDGYLVKIMPINRISTRQDLNEVINGLDFKAFERRKAETPNKPVERIHLVCMGHEPDLGSHLILEAKKSGFDIEVMVTDLIRDKAHLHFKKSSDARLSIQNGELIIEGFYPMNLLQKLSLESDAVEDWRQLVESVKVDFHYDGAVLTPEIVDAPGKDGLVTGRYAIPADAATIRVKITDLLSESWEGEIKNG